VIRRTVVALCVVLGLALVLSGCSASGDEVADDRLPDVTLAGFDGGEDVDLGEFSGPAVISLWASWCPPCRKEMPILEEFHAAYGDRITLLGIDFQDLQTEKARALVEEAGVTFALVSDQDGEISGKGAFPVLRGLPYLAFVDDDGSVTHVEAVKITSTDQLADLVGQHLGTTL
jgi:cytochrome c biogenesis protein CcmG/thiol:disulfide interchange protein DsbE